MTTFWADPGKNGAVGVLVAFAMLVAGCANNPVEQCRASVTSSLMNPETAQFFEFEQISEMEFRAGVENAAWKAAGVPPEERSKWTDRDPLKQEIDKAVASTIVPGASYRSYRIKAASRVGLTVTNMYVCKIDKSGCECVSADK